MSLIINAFQGELDAIERGDGLTQHRVNRTEETVLEFMKLFSPKRVVLRGVVVHPSYPSTWEAEEGRPLSVQSQPAL